MRQDPGTNHAAVKAGEFAGSARPRMPSGVLNDTKPKEGSSHGLRSAEEVSSGALEQHAKPRNQVAKV